MMPDRPPAVAAAEVRTLLDELSSQADPAAFQELISLSEHLGRALGVSARLLAETGSWSQVASCAGTSKQAAWERWRT
jgi:hypothetical protein